MSVTEDIKARLDIVSYISKYTQLKKSGRNYSARCPFHNERTPSFYVFPDTQYWRCFGACAEGGDIFNFVMKQEGVDFPTALRFLADQAGIELHERTEEQKDAEARTDQLRGLLEICAKNYHEALMTGAEAEQARSYVLKRGLTVETVEAFQLGYAPSGWHLQLDALKRLGYSEELIIEAGMAIRSEDAGRVYDRFRNRLMIPIRDVRGRAIGFGARALDPSDEPKYLNSPQTVLFDKSATLFGLDMARRSIRETEVAVIVEGYLDAIQAHQAGFTNVVAQMGTALTDPQLKELSKYARKLILALDSDAAGVKATMRGLDVIRQSAGIGKVHFDPRAIIRQASRLDVEIRVITLPDGLDPDDLIRDHREQWITFVNQSQPVADYVIAMGTAGITPQSSLADREQTARQLLPILIATESDLQKHVNIQQLALKLRLNEKTLLEWALSQRAASQPRLSTKAPTLPPVNSGRVQDAQPDTGTHSEIAGGSSSWATAAGNTTDALERFCLATLLNNPGWLSVVDRTLRELGVKSKAISESNALGPLVADDFSQTDYRAIFSVLLNAKDQYDVDTAVFMQQHLPMALMDVIRELSGYPLHQFEKNLDAIKQAELVQIRQDQERLGVAPTEKQLLQTLQLRALELRRIRLRRENIELHFVQQELSASSDDDPDAYQACEAHILRNVIAIRHIEYALRELVQFQR